MRGYTFATLVIAIGVAEPAYAACPSADRVTAYAASWLTNSPAKSFGPGLSLEEGYCAQKLLVEKLSASLGPKVGYKAAATNKKIQETLKLDGPLHGVLLERMLLKDGAEVSASEPYFFESDLLLRVKDEGVNSAKEPIEVLKSISEAIPFIELPSSPGHLVKGETFDGPNIAAMNAVARRGILGEPIPLNPTQDVVDALGKMEVVLLDDSGKEYARAAGSAVMGHPLTVVMWLAEELRKSGDKLKPGDLISVGSFSPLTPPVAGLTVTAQYQGLADRVGQVSVKFK